MKALILGCGRIGSVAAQDFAENISAEVVVADKSQERAKNVVEKIGRKNVSWIQLDATNQDQLITTIKRFSIVIGFLPATLGYSLAEACISAGKNLVDVSYMLENPLTLNDKAVKAGITVIPDCGLAPGISNILVGHAAEALDKVRTVHIMVGGFPQKPIKPLGYAITWSPESLIDEYTRKARIIKGGKVVKVEALSGIEKIDFPGVGKIEAFYTDGLRNLIDTLGSVEEMWEKTLRYPGHAEKVKLLKDLGFFDEKEVDVEGVKVSPRKLTVKLFEHRLLKPKVKDVVALNVEVSGIKNGKRMLYSYRLLDHYDEKTGFTAMARTTAYPASIIAQLILKNAVKEKGVVPPEKIGMNKAFFKLFLEELERRGVKITEEKIVS
ncbi:MAG: saccharopine dehydrogenase family protein [Candidatus Bathyarchaeia archaeon]